MSLNISINNTPTYNYLSSGTGLNPASSSVSLDNLGGTKDGAVATLYLVATTFNYTGISVSIVNEQTGIDWKLSLNGSTWLDTIVPSNMNALAADVVTPIYVKPVVNNNGTVSTGLYTTPDISVTYTENPA